MKSLMFFLVLSSSAVTAHALEMNRVCVPSEMGQTDLKRVTISGSDETGIYVVIESLTKAPQTLFASPFVPNGQIAARPINLDLYSYDEGNPDEELLHVGLLRTEFVGGADTGFLVLGKDEIPITCGLR